MSSKKLVIPNTEGDRLAAILELPDNGEPDAYAMFAHCFTCNKNYKGVRNISRVLSDAGIATLSLDFAGLGESEGEFSETTFSSNVSDLVCAAEYLSENYQAPKLLIGHSMGGSAAIRVTEFIENIRGIVTIGSPAETTHLRTLLPAVFNKIDLRGKADVSIAGVNFTLTKEFVDDLESQKMSETLSRMKTPYLIVHSAVDATVEVDNAEKLYHKANYPKALVTLDNADHLLSSSKDSGFVGSLIAAWASRYLSRKISGK